MINNKFSVLGLVLAALSLNACALQRGDDGECESCQVDVHVDVDGGVAGGGGSGGSGGTGGTAGAGGGNTDPEPTGCNLPAPFLPDGNHMNFSSEYVSGAHQGEVLGTLPNITWEKGYRLADGGVEGYYGMTWDDVQALKACTKETPCEFSYQDGRDAWAHYGEIADLACMPQSGLEFIQCNWFTGDAVRDLGAAGECHIKAYWDGSAFVGAGNMKSFLAFINQ